MVAQKNLMSLKITYKHFLEKYFGLNVTINRIEKTIIVKYKNMGVYLTDCR